MSSLPLKITKLPTEDVGYTEADEHVTSIADGSELVHQDFTATSVPTVDSTNETAAAPKFRRALVPVDSIIVKETFGREIDDQHIEMLAEIIGHFGNRYPPIVSEDMVLLAGHEQFLAVQHLGHAMVEVIIEMTP